MDVYQEKRIGNNYKSIVKNDDGNQPTKCDLAVDG